MQHFLGKIGTIYFYKYYRYYKFITNAKNVLTTIQKDAIINVSKTIRRGGNDMHPKYACLYDICKNHDVAIRLSSILNISVDTLFKKIQGEKDFSYEEAKIISLIIGKSLEEIFLTKNVSQTIH